MQLLTYILAAAALSAGGTRDISSLPAQQQLAYTQAISEEFCACDSALTVAGCLEHRPTCNLAKQLDELIYQSAAADVAGDEILAYLAHEITGPFCAKPAQVNTAGAPSIGNAKAPFTIIEFADFRCGHCQAAAPEIKKFLANSRNKANIRFVFMPFPLGDHPESLLAAEALLAANAQGKGWAMHEAIFAHAGEGYDAKALRAIAAGVGLDQKRFADDLKRHAFREQVLKLKSEGLKHGVQSTPSFFVNGRPYLLDTLLFTFDERIALERARTQGNCK